MGNNCSFCDGNDLVNQKKLESNCFVNRGFKMSRFEKFTSMDTNAAPYDAYSPRTSDGTPNHKNLRYSNTGGTSATKDDFTI